MARIRPKTRSFSAAADGDVPRREPILGKQLLIPSSKPTMKLYSYVTSALLHPPPPKPPNLLPPPPFRSTRRPPPRYSHSRPPQLVLASWSGTCDMARIRPKTHELR
ncbi:hypothetical protein N7516_010049 [Penicillium verrucosum]|uniref:uncharacterized protein n=1 Tax=Penicillium verrucosum TaxID=60171 RepID=UPI0025458436|nr:uncharacterized protein N7516_010049 [Penicillium verrucosum]KAJ5922346.1 hypothetical protein N7516_010049 [Penicillium verrucosum]